MTLYVRDRFLLYFFFFFLFHFLSLYQFGKPITPLELDTVVAASAAGTSKIDFMFEFEHVDNIFDRLVCHVMRIHFTLSTQISSGFALK